MKSNSKKTSVIVRNEKFNGLCESKQQQVIDAINGGRVYLSASVNGTESVAGLHYTTKHYGKMTDLVSISTSVLENPICQKRRLNKDSICYHCFSASQMNCYKQMQPIFKKNLEVLKDTLLESSDIPVILSESGLGRVESFGDVCSAVQAANYMRIASANPWLNWAAFTKNIKFYHDAIVEGLAEKPSNLNIVFSSHKMNCVDEVPEKYRYLVDRVFTVYDNKGIEEQGVTINCGALSCATCRKCYTKTNKFYIINEKLK